MNDPIKQREHEELIETFKVAAQALRTARDNVQSSEKALEAAQAAVKADRMALDGALVAFNRRAEQLGFKHPGGSGSLIFQENLLAIIGPPKTVGVAVTEATTVDTATGWTLDMYGRDWGCARMPGEGDQAYRTRVKAAMPAPVGYNPDGSASY